MVPKRDVNVPWLQCGAATGAMCWLGRIKTLKILRLYRCAIRNPVPCVHRAEPPTPQHCPDLVNLLERLLFQFNCEYKKGH